MQGFKNKLYQYETPPPEEIWDHIADELTNEKVITMHGHRKTNSFFTALLLRLRLLLFFWGLFFLKRIQVQLLQLKGRQQKKTNYWQKK